jgi:hypothetical protein
VVGIAPTCINDPDDRLRLLLSSAIADCVTAIDRGRPAPATSALDAERWAAACRLTGVGR